MFISVIHRIADSQAFASRGETLVSQAPVGVKALQFFPSEDGKRAVCLWEAESLDEAQEYIDRTLGDSSAQEYFAVEEAHAAGLPVAT